MDKKRKCIQHKYVYEEPVPGNIMPDFSNIRDATMFHLENSTCDPDADSDALQTLFIALESKDLSTLYTLTECSAKCTRQRFLTC